MYDDLHIGNNYSKAHLDLYYGYDLKHDNHPTSPTNFLVYRNNVHHNYSTQHLVQGKMVHYQH
ncbi:hypothetical protein SDC9_181942 [bioreactor metagenome]|uniref:Uncharacterized protein n=1 Tax=bioreactor metagenome TaxID=1076179 RepID=A0A645H8N1_9ZZZZ